MPTVYFSLADIPEHGQLMFILGTLVLYPQCRIELSVMRQQMLESGGKKILLGADAAEGQTAEQDLAEALDKTLDNLRKVVTSRTCLVPLICLPAFLRRHVKRHRGCQQR